MEVPVIQFFLRNKLHQQIQRQGVDLNPQDIPVYAIKDLWPLRYQSAIALKLATLNPQHPTDIASEILPGLLDSSQYGEIQITITSSGLIEFQLTVQVIAAWLQQMTQTPLSTENLSFSSEGNLSEFALQYSHARCCSLLRLAHRDRMITLAEPDFLTASPSGLFINPNPIPWLDCDGKLHFNHHTEHQLIWQLFTTLDACYTSFDQRVWKNKADLLSQAFQAFYSQCRIWGEVKLKTPERSQARLGLIGVTQLILQFILQEKLNRIAPLEL